MPSLHPHHVANTARATLAAASLICILAAASAQAAPLVANSNFNTPYDGGVTQTLTTDSNGGQAQSAAAIWIMFNDSAGTTTTDLEPSSLVPGGSMIHVTTSIYYAGIAETFPQHGPTNVYTCDWIYVVSGAVGIGSGPGGATQIDAAVYKTGSWEVLNVGNQITPANNTILYNISNGPAEFYVESVQVSASHAQCKPK